MSILFDPSKNPEEAMWTDSSGVCFYCGKTLTFPCVMWSCQDLIFIHPDCVEEWFERMKWDVMEIRKEI